MIQIGLKDLLKQAPESGKTVLGAFIFSPDPDISAVYGYAGFDFVVVDMEHGANDVRSVAGHVRACQATGIRPIVRLGVANFPDAGRLLDAGAAGFMLPHYGMSSYGANEVVRAMSYAPKGSRPTCTGVPAAGFGLLPFAEVAQASNENVVSMGLIEDAQVVERIESILDEVSVDCLMPGPADLATSMGLHGQLRHPDILGAIEKIKSAAGKRRIPVGLYINDPAEIEGSDPAGVAFYVYSIDYKSMANHLRNVQVTAHEIYKKATSVTR
ncbi:HpcH/HpaI aldolase/citrate lyase family protein [Bordetella sp. BOR01]|uniref:HpcH/HpaI aldolase family protein n=1 Tax=Bordetella sp. BOR01 TaxID=2854779 RepID=UPI002107F165|nr:aldolase/citrate lyase family protein [Bordetella sp. BOR01]